MSQSAVEWRSLPGASDYEVSFLGSIRRIRRRWRYPAGKVLKSWIGTSGYPYCQVITDEGRKLKRGVHQFVASAFLPPRPTARHEVAHFNGDKKNPAADNLRWATRRENLADCLRHGTRRYGETHQHAKLTVEAVRNAIAAVEDGEPCASVAKRYGVNPSTIDRAFKGLTWGRALQSLRENGVLAGPNAASKTEGSK